MATLKDLNQLLLKGTVELREQNKQLLDELAALAADPDMLNETERDVCRIVLSSNLSDAAARITAEMAAAAETAGKMMMKTESVAAELNAADIRLAVVGTEKDSVERDLERVTEERDLTQCDLDGKCKVYADLEETIRLLKQELAEMAKQREAADAKCAKLEEEGRRMKGELQSAMKEKLKEKNLKAEEIVSLQMQLNKSSKKQHMMEMTIEELQRKVNHVAAENRAAKKQIDCSIVDKASLQKQLETSNQGLQDVQKKFKGLENSSAQVFALLKKMIAEVIEEEGTQENHISKEDGVVEVENDEEMKLFVDNLEAIKLAVKGKETTIKDLNQKLELLQLSVAHAKNIRSICRWLLFPATTGIFAAAFLAYAARAR